MTNVYVNEDKKISVGIDKNCVEIRYPYYESIVDTSVQGIIIIKPKHMKGKE